MEIPDHIWLEISIFLSPKELCALALVSKAFNVLASNNYPWKAIMIKILNGEPKFMVNIKKNLAESNRMATWIINDYQSEAHNLEIILGKERKRQQQVLDFKRRERQLNRSLKQNEMIKNIKLLSLNK